MSVRDRLQRTSSRLSIAGELFRFLWEQKLWWMIPMFALIDTKNIMLYGVALFVLTIGLGLSYGPMSAMYAEMFPANVRYSGISIGYAFGAILGGAFASSIAEWLLQSTRWTGSIGIYIMILCVISAIGVLLAKETKGRLLGVSRH